MGDCLGSPFEGDARVTKSVLVQYFKNMNDAHTNKSKLLYDICGKLGRGCG